MVQLEIDTYGARPTLKAPCRAPFALRHEIARQLTKMQSQGVITPSSSDWASRRKKTELRELNSTTKADLFCNLLDLLGESKFFSPRLASGYWQVPDSEKTAFITHQGLYEFRVMPFRQCVLRGLNPEDGVPCTWITF